MWYSITVRHCKHETFQMTIKMSTPQKTFLRTSKVSCQRQWTQRLDIADKQAYHISHHYHIISYRPSIVRLLQNVQKCITLSQHYINKKLSYRRETARQLPTWRGLGPPAHSPSAPSGYTYAYGRIRKPQRTYVKRAVH